MRPTPYKNLKDPPTYWVDYVTGRGMLSNGQIVQAKIGARRKNPNLTDILDTAAQHGVERVMFTGKVPLADAGQRHWLLVQTPGWKSLGHWVAAPVTGRFERIATGQRVQIRTAAEWFGSLPLNPAEARDAWDATKFMISEAFDGAPIGFSPAATGTNLWAMSLPRNLDPEPVSRDIAEELHRTSGQHHLEHLVAGPSHSNHPDTIALIDPSVTPKIDSFSYVDGRFMYAALCRELGTGPGQRLRGPETMDLMRENPYLRARVLIRFKVPDTWNHVGIFAVQHPNASAGWYYPNRPGAVGETWADTAEIHVAQKHGWLVEPIESVVFSQKMPGRDKNKLVATKPLDTFANRITRAREWVTNDEEMPPKIQAAVAAALRAILLQAIGGFASRGRGNTVVTEDPQSIPPQYLGSAKRQGKLWVYKVPSELQGNQLAYYRPELAVQVWARGRSRVLEAPTATPGVFGGALHVDPRTLLGINGDAIYTTEIPRWALPVENGGGDDGRTGRLRMQGFLEGPLPTPTTLEERDKLRLKSQRAGLDGAINFLDFSTPDDLADFQISEEQDA